MKIFTIGTLLVAVILLLFLIVQERRSDCFLFRSKRKTRGRKVRAGSIEYYRIYKNMYMQLSIGVRPFEMMKRLHLMTEHGELKKLLMEMSEMIVHSNSIDRGIDLLKKRLADEESVLFLNMLENSARTGFSPSAMRQLDHLFFQKYLIDIKRKVKRVKRRYVQSAFMFCAAVFIAILLPVADQMLRSLQSIFTSY